MYKYSDSSLLVVSELDPSYEAPLMEVIKRVDIKLLEGRRIEDRQNMLFDEGRTTVKYPDSAHNPLKDSDRVFAFDAMPYYPEKPHGVDWRGTKELWAAVERGDMKEAAEILENIKRMRHCAGVIIGVFHAHGIPLVNGADWDGDNRFDDHNFVDSPHYQHMYWKRLRQELNYKEGR